MSATDGVQAPDRGRLAGGGRPRAAPRDRDQQARPRAGRLRPGAGGGPRGLRRRGGPGRAARSAPRRPSAGVIDLLDDTATLYDARAAPPVTGTEGPIPDDLANEEHEVHEQLVEGIVVGDDDLMARYLDGETISRAASSRRPWPPGSAAGAVFPVLCCSAITGVGVDRLARLLVELAPPPDRRPPVEVRGRRAPRSRSPATRRAARSLAVCKTLSDQHAGRLSLCKVVSGTIRPDVVLVNPRTRTEERLHVLELAARPRGQPRSTRRWPGDFVAVPRLTGTAHRRHPGPQGHPGERPGAPSPEPAGAAGRRSDPARGPTRTSSCPPSSGCARRTPRLAVTRDDETHQTVLGVAGEVHLAVTLERLARKFGVNGRARGRPRPLPRDDHPARPRPRAATRSRPGGHGQFGVVPPARRAARRGARASSSATRWSAGPSPASTSRRSRRACVEAMDQGGVFGYPVVDVAVTCRRRQVPLGRLLRDELQDGRRPGLPAGHGRRPARSCSSRSRRLEVTVPADLQGDVLGRPALPAGPGPGHRAADDGLQTIIALVPDGRAVPLRRRPAGHHRRPGAVPGRPTTTTTRCPSTWWPAPKRGAAPPQRAGRPGLGRSLLPGVGSDSGSTRTPATEVMKLVSPDQRGTTWRWRWRGDPGPGGPAEVGPEVEPVGS